MSKWERITDDMDRLVVPGGWIYRARNPYMGSAIPEALVFVPHANWVPDDNLSPGYTKR